MEIVITQDDINKGVRGSTKDCAIARALKRQFNTENICVGPDYMGARAIIDGQHFDLGYKGGKR